MKKAAAWLLAGSLCISLLAGCSKDTPASTPERGSDTAETEENEVKQQENKKEEPKGMEHEAAESTALVLTVNPNYEDAKSYTVEKNSGDRIGDGINNPARRGYTFQGWTYDEEGSQGVGPEDTIDKNQTIYASWEAWDAATAEWMDTVLTEAEQARYISNFPTAYTKESFDAYMTMAAPILFLTMGGNVFPQEMQGLVYGLAGAREALELAPNVSDPEDTIWYIWGEDIAAEPEAGSYDYYGTWDNAGFKPFLVPCMLENQNEVKGNIILISGGGFEQRANRWEAYPAAGRFNDLGYNCFILQRRVAPSKPIDAGLDLQRAIRYLKYYAKEYGIAKIENLAAAGYSGGGSTITYQVEQLYGDIQSTAIYPDYQCDEVDAVNADLEAMIMVYSAMPLETENPNIPDAFVVVGIQDEYGLEQKSIEALSCYEAHDIRYEAHFFSDAGHGFGQGFGLNATAYTDENVENVKVWPSLADQFLRITFGLEENITAMGQ